MAAAAASDRLSDLSDDVLIHVLSFLPSNEAARTAVLSRRWRCPLWLDTGAVNLDSRSYATTGRVGASPVTDADHAVAFQHSHGRVPSKVSVIIHNHSMHDDVLRAACRDEAAVEELRLDCKDGGWPPCSSYNCKRCPKSEAMYSLQPELLPFAALRVLDLNGCHLIGVKQPQTSRDSRFPFLAALRLRLCAMEVAVLQDLVTAAPVLADISFESLSFTDLRSYDNLRLRCPTATALAIANMVGHHIERCTVEIDAPLLRCFRYNQHVWFGDETVSFKSPPPAGLKRVDIKVCTPAAQLGYVLDNHECHTRLLKLTVFSIADMDKRLLDFPNLERLEIEEMCGCLDDRAAAASAMMQMMCRCPAIREIRIKFTYLDGTGIDPADHAAAMSELTPCRSMFDGIGHCCKVSHFPLSPPDYYWSMTRWRQSPRRWGQSLRKVVVRSDVPELTCFQVQLISFLARNAESLEEVDIISTGGSRYSDRKVAEWRATPWIESLAGPHRRRHLRHTPPPLISFPPLGDHSAGA